MLLSFAAFLAVKIFALFGALKNPDPEVAGIAPQAIDGLECEESNTIPVDTSAMPDNTLLVGLKNIVEDATNDMLVTGFVPVPSAPRTTTSEDVAPIILRFPVFAAFLAANIV
jgi:hypothetical protein